RSRFLTEKVLKTLDAVSWQSPTLGSSEHLGSSTEAVSVDMSARLREMW
ncbi:MAG: hypothetical protein JO274_12390, partial [Gammaproteobacteria bacterium]|nr:hypothetical protein [Gammaproteobacteria bacterium]